MIINNQTMQERLAIFHAYLAAMKERGLQQLCDDTHNFSLIGSQIDAMGLVFSYEGVTKAVNQLGWQKLHWMPSPSELARQQAAQSEAAQQTAFLNQWFESAQRVYGIVNDDVNAKMVADYLLKNFRGVPSKVALDAFIRENLDNPQLHKLATPAQEGLTPDEMWARQNTQSVYNPEHIRQQRIAKAKEAKEKFDIGANEARSRAELEAELKRVRTFRDVRAMGISWAGTFAKQKEMLSALLAKYPQYKAEIEAALSKVGR
jgi:hypothetical protein